MPDRIKRDIRVATPAFLGAAAEDNDQVMSATEKTAVEPSLWTDAALVEAALPTLRNAWLEAADLARTRKMPGLRNILESRLARVAREHVATEPALLDIAGECQAMVAVVASDPVADEIGRRLRRGVYEYLLAIDARRHSQADVEEFAQADPAISPFTGNFAAVEIESVRSVVAEHLAAGRYADCAALLTRITQRQRGHDLAEVACAAGRACRAAGEVRAAADCFQASCLADPEYEDATPISR